MKGVSLIVAASLLLSGVPVGAFAQDAQDYASREAQSRELEEFTGGFHEVVVGVFVVALVAAAVWAILTHHHWHHHHPLEPCPIGG